MYERPQALRWKAKEIIAASSSCEAWASGFAQIAYRQSIFSIA